MMMRYALLAGTVLLALPLAARAEAVNGLYIGGGGGANFLQNEVIKGTPVPGNAGANVRLHPKFDTGWTGIGSVGYGFGNGFRVELEGNYRSNDLRSVGPITGKQSGSEQKYGAMVNALYDFDLSQWGVSFYNMSPYLGVGAGWVNDRWQGVNIATGGPGGTLTRINNGENGFAYQGIAGAAFPLTSMVPGLSLTVEYRFFDEPEDHKFAAQYFAPGVTAGPKVKVANEINHSVLVGLRYAFNQAPPPPPAAVSTPVAAPAPAPARTYLVFFDWDKADLTDRARSVIADAAQNSTRVQYTRIEASGYADLTGSHPYNQQLSLRRAQNVAAELVRDGVPQTVIDIHGYGDTHPLVPTAEGVREPQNRRVEIILH